MSYAALADAQSKLSRAQYLCSINPDDEESRSLALRAVTTLNAALREQHGDPPMMDPMVDPTVLRRVCADAIEIYQRIKTRSMTFDERLTWMASMVNGLLCPPVDEDVFITDSAQMDQLKLSTSQNELLEEWRCIKHQYWGLDGLNHVYQDFLQDCSFVTSLISLARNNGPMLLDTILPHRESSRYGVLFHFNGCKRLVEIGPELPIMKDGKSLFIKSRTNEDLLWPALLEKAYLKMKGHGYDSHGSNASIDSYFISGWIPQFITASQVTSMNQLWDLLYDDFQNNNLVLALGTGEHPGDEFAKNHDYAITELIPHTKSIVVKNPWMKNVTMMKLEDIFHSFETLYLNWNPNKFGTKRSINCIWNNTMGTLYHSPQVHIKNTGTSTTEVKVLLERHQGSDPSSINVTFYKSNGERLFSKGIPLTTSTANSTGFHLSSVVLAPEESCTAVISSNASCIQNFTLHTYSNNQLILERAQHKYSTLKTIDDEWDIDSCGGNWSYQSYIKNPQYEIIIPPSSEDVHVQFALFTKSDTLVNLQLFFQSDKPFTHKQSIITAKYHPGSLIHHTTLKSGQKYKLVASTYDPDIHANFKLIINASSPLTITRISTRLGLFIKPFTFAWNNKNRFRVSFTVERATAISIHLWISSATMSSYRPRIRASLFYKDGTPIQINEEFDDCLYGIWLDKTTVQPGRNVILLVERFEIGNDEVFGEIGSDHKITLVK